MRKMMMSALVMTGLLAGNAMANGPGGFTFGFGQTFNVHWGSGGGGGGGGAPHQLGPWYLYWPYEAHFQTPALPQYPYWPTGQSLPPGMPLMGAPVMAGPSAYPAAYPASQYGHQHWRR